MRSLVTLILCAAATLGARAAAEPLVNPSGVVLGEPFDPTIGLVMGPPVWVAPDGSYVARDRGFSSDPSNDIAPLRCWDVSASPPVPTSAPLDRLGPSTPPPDELAVDGHLAVTSTGDTFVVATRHPRQGTSDPFRVQIFSASCAAGPTLLRTLEASDVDAALQGELATERHATWPARADGIIYVPGRDGLLLRIDPSATPAVTRLVDSDAWYAALRPGAAHEAGNWQIVGALMTPDAHLWVAVEGASARGGDRSTTFVAVDDDGGIQVVHGPDRLSGGTALLRWDVVHAAVLVGGQAVFGFAATTPEPVAAPGRPARQHVFAPIPFDESLQANETPWPIVADANQANAPTNVLGADPASGAYGFIGSADGRLVNCGRDLFYRPLDLDPSVADFDRDHLSATREAELGLDDLDSDSDDDGVNDGAEVSYFHSDPKALNDRPPVIGALPRVAPSNLRGDLTVFQPSEVDQPSAEPVLCHTFLTSLPRQPTRMLGCIDPSGNHVKTPEYIYGRWSFTPDGPEPDDVDVPRYLYYDDFTEPLGQGDRIRARFDTESEEVVELEREDCAQGPCPELDPLYAIDGDVYLTLGTTPATLSHVTRHMRGAAPFEIIDPQRSACPVLARPDDACGGPRPAQITNVSVLGWDPRHGAWFVLVSTTGGGSLYAVSATDVAFVSDAFALPLDGQLLQIRAHPGSHLGAGFMAAGLFQTPQQGNYLGAVQLDDALGRVAVDQAPIQPPDRFGAFFKDGFIGVRYPPYWIDPREGIDAGDLGCVSVDGISICDAASAYRYDPKQVAVAELVEYVEVPEPLEPGEVLFAALGRHADAQAQRLRDALTPEPEGAWALWRVTALGGVTPWLDEGAFVDRVGDSGTRAELATARVGPITGMGAASDGRRVCLAEPDAGRLWELTLSDGLLVDVRLVQRGPIVACSYGRDGDDEALGWVTTSPPALHVADATFPLPGRLPTGLVGRRDRDEWVVVDQLGTAVCARSRSGTSVVDTGKQLIAAAPGLQPEYFDSYIDRDGKVWSSTGLCAGAEPDLSLFEGGLSVWQHGYTFMTVRPVEVQRASLAVRPDGMVVLAPSGVTWNSFAEDLVFRLTPTYTPTGHHSASGTTVLDHTPWRRDSARVTFMATEPTAVTAMVTLPGAPPRLGNDWERLVDVEGEPDPDPGADAGPEPTPEGTANGAETSRHQPSDDCCGGGGAGSLVSWGLVVVVLARRSRRAAAYVRMVGFPIIGIPTIGTREAGRGVIPKWHERRPCRRSAMGGSRGP